MKYYTNVDKLRKDITDSIEANISSLQNDLIKYINSDVKAETKNTLRIPNTARLTKSRPPSSSQIVEGISPNIVQEGNGGFTIHLWHVPTLEANSTPDAESIPIWSMLNWGSGEKVKTTSDARGGSSISTVEYLQYTRPITTRKEAPYTTSKPPTEKDSGFLWRPKLGRGRRGEGYYIPKTTVDRVNAQRALRGKKEKLTTEPMQYYTPQFYIEHSISLILGRMKTLLSKQNSGLVSTNPIY